jgi:hypothetical protein
MVRVRGRYRDGKIELDRPLGLPDGTAVEITVDATPETADEEWHELGMSRLEEEWDNDQDAVYDDWRRLYGVQPP